MLGKPAAVADIRPYAVKLVSRPGEERVTDLESSLKGRMGIEIELDQPVELLLGNML